MYISDYLLKMTLCKGFTWLKGFSIPSEAGGVSATGFRAVSLSCPFLSFSQSLPHLPRTGGQAGSRPSASCWSGAAVCGCVSCRSCDAVPPLISSTYSLCRSQWHKIFSASHIKAAQMVDLLLSRWTVRRAQCEPKASKPELLNWGWFLPSSS